jgi:hypothetical protein
MRRVWSADAAKGDEDRFFSGVSRHSEKTFVIEENSCFSAFFQRIPGSHKFGGEGAVPCCANYFQVFVKKELHSALTLSSITPT